MHHMLKVTLSILLLATGIANAGEGLYGKVPPTDAAFFRFINLSPESVEIAYQGNKISTLKSFNVTSYGFDRAGDFEFSVNDKKVSLELAVNELATLIWENGEISKIIVKIKSSIERRSHSKALIIINYNIIYLVIKLN